MTDTTTPEAVRGPDQPIIDLLGHARMAAAHELAALIDRCAQELGASRAIAYLADLQQQVLVPFIAPSGPGDETVLTVLSVDATLAGRTFQTFDVHTQDAGIDGIRIWLPLLVGTDRLGVLGVTVDDAALLEPDGTFVVLLARLASVAAELIVSKSGYGDTVVRLRRRTEMGLAAEMQWSLLPALTFTSRPVTVAAALEPAYHVAGDTIDYAVDAGMTSIAIFDGMGHGLQSAQCAVLAVAAYRNARRSYRSLTETMNSIDEALVTALAGEVFTTAVLAQLDTDSGLLQWANAGHPEPLLLRNGRLVKTLHLDPRPPLGFGDLLPGDPVAIGNEQLEPGDRVLLYTDGVVEARSPDGEFFGVDRLVDLVVRHLAGGLPAPETMRRVVRELLDHQQGPLSDDATLLMLEWRGDNEEAVLT
ncbi:MAG TPA: PP2C family protein-serine/threonine phosphatase [Mycobacteriales bacterium]|nr:PP2C family protein-serine/threonine phosphatase [Mycobacteriales bacterium]